MYTQRQSEALNIVVDFTAGLSLLGCLFIILVYLFFKELRVFAFKLVLHMTVCDSIRCVGFLLVHADKSLCEVQAVLVQAGSLGSILWNGVIARTLYLSVVKDMRGVENTELKYTALVYTVTLVLTGLPWTTLSYGDSEGWCWIKGEHGDYLAGNIWRAVCLYFPLLLVTLNNLYSYYHIIRTLRQGFAHPEITSLVHKLRFYPVILIMCYICALLKRVYNLVKPDADDFPFALVAALTLGSIGLVDAVIYGFTQSVRVVIKQRLCPKGDSRSASSLSEGGINFI